MSHLFKIPNKSGKAETIYVIGIIDCSGSMSSYWQWVAGFWNQNIPKDNCVTITFDTKPKVVSTNVLDMNINVHGGGGTKIPEAFQVFEEKLKELPNNASVNAVFISDGQDNYMNTVESRCNSVLKGAMGYRINFMCLGIQSGFPTFLSMKLRQLYHTGDDNIPAIYLIEYASEKAFFNKFETMKPYFSKCSRLDIIPPVRLYPWEKPVEEVYEGSWVLCEEPFIVVNDEKYPHDPEAIGVEEIVDIFRGWVQKLQLISLQDPKQSKEDAVVCLKEMELALDNFKKKSGIDLREKNEQLGSTFSQRVMKNLIKNVGVRAIWFMDEVQSIAKGVNPKALNEYDAAKRIGIGTITGKYHQKALALKGITINDFKLIAQEFKEIFLKTKLNEEVESEQLKSVITLQNQKDVFLDKDLIKGLDLCKSQYDLVEAFPVIGYAIKLKRFDGSMINPWLTQVRFIAKQHKAIDSSILVTNQMKLELPVLDKKEEINCVLPLFDEKDKELMPLINSRLYRLLMTFLVMQNVDFYYDEAYLALLVNAFIFMFTFEQSEWRDEILELIYKTVKMTYEGEISFKKYLGLFIEDPVKAFFETSENIDSKEHIDLCKPIFFLYYCFREKLLSPEELQKRFDFILIDYVNCIFATSKKKYHDFFVFGFQKDDCEKDLMSEMDIYYSISEFTKTIHNKVADTMKIHPTSVKLNKKLLYQEDEKIRLQLLERFQKLVFGEGKVYGDKEYVQFIYHVEKHGHGKSEDRFTAPVEKDGHKIKEATIASLGLNKIGKLSNFTQMQTQLRKSFIDRFGERHWEVRPFERKELMELCVKHNVNVSDIKFKPSGLFLNACNAPNCPFFMKVTNEVELKKHLDTWVGRMPLGFHKFVAKHMEKENEEIFDKLLKERNFSLELFQVTKAFTLNYIDKVKNYYKQLPKEEIVPIHESIEKIDKVLGAPNYISKASSESKKKKHAGAGRGRGQRGNRGGGRGNRGGGRGNRGGGRGNRGRGGP